MINPVQIFVFSIDPRNHEAFMYFCHNTVTPRDTTITVFSCCRQSKAPSSFRFRLIMLFLSAIGHQRTFSLSCDGYRNLVLNMVRVLDCHFMNPTFILVVIDLLYPESNLQFIERNIKNLIISIYYSFFSFLRLLCRYNRTMHRNEKVQLLFQIFNRYL